MEESYFTGGSGMYKSGWFDFALLINLGLSAILTYYATSLRVYVIVEGSAQYSLGYVTVLGWIIAFWMTLYTFWKKSILWFVLTIIAGWVLPVVFFFNPFY